MRSHFILVYLQKIVGYNLLSEFMLYCKTFLSCKNKVRDRFRGTVRFKDELRCKLLCAGIFF